MFAWIGKGPTDSEKIERQQVIEGVANEFERIAEKAAEDVDVRREFDSALSQLHSLGKRPLDSLVNNVAQAIVSKWDVQ
jgi:hypothetical protein